MFAEKRLVECLRIVVPISRGTDIAKFKFTFKVRHMKTDIERIIYDNPGRREFPLHVSKL